MRTPYGQGSSPNDRSKVYISIPQSKKISQEGAGEKFYFF
jgi:hypothetical protein